MTTPDFRSRLKDEDARLGDEGLPPEVDRRLRARLDASIEARESRSWFPAPLRLALGGGLVAATAALVLLLRPTPPAPPRVIGGYTVVASNDAASAHAESDATVVIDRGGLVFEDDRGGRIVATTPGRIRNDSGHLRVLEGQVDVQVAHRAPGAEPYRVLVSHGAIAVLGTRFTIDQTSTGGSVLLHEGSIRLEHVGGVVEQLVPGQRASWPRPEVPSLVAPSPPKPIPPPAPAPPKPAPTRPAPPPVVREDPPPAPPPPPAPAPPPSPELVAEMKRADELLERIAILRSRGRFDEAANVLAGELAGYGTTTRERLSYELVSILTFQVGDRPRACAAWQGHVAAFGRGRYDRELEQARQHAGCTVP